MPNNPHIGKLIRQRAEDLKMGTTQLADMVATSKQNMHGIYSRKSVDSELLDKIGRALRYDFFRYYTGGDDLPDDVEVPYENGAILTIRKLSRSLEQAERELSHLMEKYEYVKKINELLEEKVANR